MSNEENNKAGVTLGWSREKQIKPEIHFKEITFDPVPPEKLE
jgi:hypothetical protein